VGEARDVAVTLAGAGDPLIHPDAQEFVQRIRAAGALAIEVRTELLSPTAVAGLQAIRPDVITVDLHAVDAPGYRVMMGPANFAVAINAVHALVNLRDAKCGGLPIPWVLPRVERLRESVAWVPMFLQLWQRDADGAVVDAPPQRDPWGNAIDDALMSAGGDASANPFHPQHRITVLSDGRVPMIDGDLLGNSVVGSIDQEDVVGLYRLAMARRKTSGVGITHPLARFI